MNITGTEIGESARQIMQERLRELRTELKLGEAELHALQRRQEQLRDTLLRISGAIQVLQELGAGQAEGVLEESA